VDFPIPRAPMMQVRPWGILMLKPGRNPPLISIFSMTHICSASAGLEHARHLPIPCSLVVSGVGSFPYSTSRPVCPSRERYVRWIGVAGAFERNSTVAEKSDIDCPQVRLEEMTRI